MLLIELFAEREGFEPPVPFAEREGFEPPVPLGTVVFKTTVIDHSTISPVLVVSKAGAKVLRIIEN